MLIPDHETSVDFLNNEAISNTVVALLRESRERAVTVGIHGDWGAGKSSVLRMIQDAFSEDENVVCLWFNGWTFQGFEDAKTVLIEATITELCRQKSTVGKVKEKGKDLLKRVDLLKLLRHGGGLAFNVITGLPSPDQVELLTGQLSKLREDASNLTGEDVRGGIDKALTFLKPAEEERVTQQIHQFRTEFEALLEEAKVDHLVVLIDDLDRCLPDTAIATLEAIRLFLFVRRSAFVIGADEGMIEYAVRQHFPDLPAMSGPVPYARNYLEKLIQVPFRLPSLGFQETQTYVTLLLAENIVDEHNEAFSTLLAKAKAALNRPWEGAKVTESDVVALSEPHRSSLAQAFLLSQQISPVLAEGTKGNPRQIKRFLNTLLVRKEIAKARGFGESISQSVLAKLMLAEHFQPDFFNVIASQAMASDSGKPEFIRELETALASDDEDLGTETEAKKKARGKSQKKDEAEEPEASKWLEREWLKRWLSIKPVLSDTDLRSYIFVAREKRIVGQAREEHSNSALIEQLCGPKMTVRGLETTVSSLEPAAADEVFNGLREKIAQVPDFSTEPSGFQGMCIVAKHHPRHQASIFSLLSEVGSNRLGIWVVAGWSDIVSDPDAKESLRALLTKWANQNENGTLKRAAAKALSSFGRGR
ncbi:MAG: NTPase KAP [Magnetovibrio sp.]|nr:NTPase KAP [Magnetovibrio sp.]|tara:strand:- start:11549 stop:13492 length:1944 start_codon:yes stop_codon:yes gene_type:complete